MRTYRGWSTRAAGLLTVAALVTGGCSREDLLSVNTPDQLQVTEGNSPAGAAALRAAAVGNFNNFYSGTVLMGVVLYVGVLSDELINARPGGEHLDIRAFNPNVFPNRPWENFSNAYTQIIRATGALQQYGAEGATRNTQVGNLLAIRGIATTIVGELFCNGVPLSDVADVRGEQPTTTTVTTTQLYEQSIRAFDSALAVLGTTGADVNQRYLARIGKARALVNLNRYADAAAVVKAGGDGAGSVAVPSDFVFRSSHSQTSNAHAVYDWMVGTANFGPSDNEGGNGLNFRSANDPRVVIGTTFRLGQDGSTQVYTIAGYPDGNTSSDIATGVEARLIEAEAALKEGDITGYLAALNAPRADAAVRASRKVPISTDPAVLPPLTDPGTPEGRVDLLFRERAFWMYLTGHRVGDLRRLVRQYGRNSETVWPTGAYFKGGVYGTDQNLIPMGTELTNPGWTACTDRNA